MARLEKAKRPQNLLECLFCERMLREYRCGSRIVGCNDRETCFCQAVRADAKATIRTAYPLYQHPLPGEQ